MYKLPVSLQQFLNKRCGGGEGEGGRGGGGGDPLPPSCILQKFLICSYFKSLDFLNFNEWPKFDHLES